MDKPKTTQSPFLDNDISFINNSDGIVYFSCDNGLTWENKSAGLPSAANIGLGGISVSKNKLALLSKDSGLYFFNIREDRWFNIPTEVFTLLQVRELLHHQ